MLYCLWHLGSCLICRASWEWMVRYEYSQVYLLKKMLHIILCFEHFLLFYFALMVARHTSWCLIGGGMTSLWDFHSALCINVVDLINRAYVVHNFVDFSITFEASSSNYVLDSIFPKDKALCLAWLITLLSKIQEITSFYRFDFLY